MILKIKPENSVMKVMKSNNKVMSTKIIQSISANPCTFIIKIFWDNTPLKL